MRYPVTKYMLLIAVFLSCLFSFCYAQEALVKPQPKFVGQCEIGDREKIVPLIDRGSYPIESQLQKDLKVRVWVSPGYGMIFVHLSLVRDSKILQTATILKSVEQLRQDPSEKKDPFERFEQLQLEGAIRGKSIKCFYDLYPGEKAEKVGPKKK